MFTFNIIEKAQEVFGKVSPVDFSQAMSVVEAGYKSNAKTPIFPEAIARQPVTNEDENLKGGIKRAIQTGIPLFDRVEMRIPSTDGAVEIFQMPDSTIFHYSRAKKSEITQLKGRNGAVMETMGNEFYTIRTYGFIINGEKVGGDYIEKNTMPMKKMQSMDALMDAGSSFQIDSLIANVLGIFHVTPIYIDFPPMPGYSNVQPFELHFMQDEPIELVI